MPPPALETELKLRILTQSALAAAAREIGDAPSEELTSVYYDTAGGSLGAAGLALRVRSRGGTYTQTLKGPLGDARARLEIEGVVPSAEPDPALLWGTPAEDVVGHEALVARYGVRVSRRSLERRIGDARVEFSLDVGEVFAGADRAPVAELELELKDGHPDVLYAEARRLTEQAPLLLDFTTKASRGAALLSRAGVRVPPHVENAPKTAGALFVMTVRRELENLAAAAEEVGVPEAPDPEGADERTAQTPPSEAPPAALEGVHQARVALRRLKVAFGAYKEALASGEGDILRTELNWLGGELADARELDVFAQSRLADVEGEDLDPGALAALRTTINLSLRAALGRAQRALYGRRGRALLVDASAFAELLRWADAPAGREIAGRPARAFAVHVLERRRKAFARGAKKIDWSDPAACHALRIHTKKLRYTSEMMAFACEDPDAQAAYSGALKAVQDALGRMNDLRMAPIAAALAQASAPPDLERAAAYAAGFLVGRASAGREGAERAAAAALKRLRKTPEWWRG